MRRTTLGDLALPFVVVGLAMYILFRLAYGSIPPLQYFLPVPIAILAVVELALARRVRSVVSHEPGAKLMTAISVARCVALGKASALVAAGVCGAAAGIILRVLPDASTVQAAGHDLRVALLLFAAGLLLLVAGLLVERAGIDPSSKHPPHSNVPN